MWHYAARVVKGDFEDDRYELVEVYPDFEGAVTKDSVKVYGDSRSSLAKWLRQAADDVERYDVIEGGD